MLFPYLVKQALLRFSLPILLDSQCQQYVTVIKKLTTQTKKYTKRFIGLFQKKIYTILLMVLIFKSPWISDQIYCNPPGIFHLFALKMPCFFLNLCEPPWNFNDFYSTPWNIPGGQISSTGELQYFSGKAHFHEVTHK